MWHDLWRTLCTVAVAMVIGIGGVTLVGCEDEPDNGVHIEEDNGVDIETDPPGDN